VQCKCCPVLGPLISEVGDEQIQVASYEDGTECDHRHDPWLKVETVVGTGRRSSRGVLGVLDVNVVAEAELRAHGEFVKEPHAVAAFKAVRERMVRTANGHRSGGHEYGIGAAAAPAVLQKREATVKARSWEQDARSSAEGETKSISVPLTGG
jgi:hypothetical protein